ncbi:MAG: FAD-dependent oxidoreductase [Treponema sp.]|nr:FAD-dependent oxidoreductase [Treponema sp.]
MYHSRLGNFCPDLGTRSLDLGTDGLPVMGRVTQVPGLVMCCGHEGDGIALAPISGKLVAEEIVYGKTSFPIVPCAAERFRKPAWD